MNRLAGWMMRLYPAKWRARYGEELQALLADTGADAHVVGDLFRGGIRMQFSTWSFPKLAAVLGLVGILLGVGGSFLLTPVYTSKATMEIAPAKPSQNEIDRPTIGLNKRIQELQSSVVSRNTLSRLIEDPQLDLYRKERTARPLDDVIEDMRQHIRVEIVALPGAMGRQASAFNIIFSYPDRRKAQATVQKMMEAFQKQNESQVAAAGATKLIVLDPASSPVTPSKPNRTTMAVFGFLVGVIVAAIAALLRRKPAADVPADAVTG